LKKIDKELLQNFMNPYLRHTAIAIMALVLLSCAGYRDNKIRSEYCQLKNEKEASTKFSDDLKKGTIKYFYIGYGPSADMVKDWKLKYNIKVIDIRGDLCAGYLWYNKYVENYIVTITRKCCVRKNYANPDSTNQK